MIRSKASTERVSARWNPSRQTLGLFGPVEEIDNGSGHVDGGNFVGVGFFVPAGVAITNRLLEETILEAVGAMYQQESGGWETGSLGFGAGMDRL